MLGLLTVDRELRALIGRTLHYDRALSGQVKLGRGCLTMRDRQWCIRHLVNSHRSMRLLKQLAILDVGTEATLHARVLVCCDSFKRAALCLIVQRALSALSLNNTE